MASLIHSLDEKITQVVLQWSIYSTTILATIIASVAWQVYTSRDADLHPMLLARQSQPSPVRQPGASAVYRAHSSPHGMPLVAGLKVKDEGDPQWSTGRNGDLRDIWRKVVAGVEKQGGTKTGQLGKLITVLGKEQQIEHDLGDVTRQINLIGQQLQQHGSTRVAIFLPNSLELLAALFACAFYDMTAILLPYAQKDGNIQPLLEKSKADAIIAAVGSFAFDDFAKGHADLRQVIWVVDEGSRHLDWNEVPEEAGGSVTVSTWQDIVNDTPAGQGIKPLPVNKETIAKSVITFWPSGEMTEHSQSNLVAGVAGQQAALPAVQRLTSADTFLAADSLSTLYPLILTLMALYSNATVVLNSVAGRSPSLELATQGAAPTVIVCSATSLAQVHSSTHSKLTSPLYAFVHNMQKRTLVQNGVMPVATLLSRLFDHLRPVIGTTAGKLRLIYVSEQVGAPAHPLSAAQLSDIRIYTGSRVIYALTAKEVAGTVCQTGVYDYRADSFQGRAEYSHFGPPTPCLELFLRDTKQHATNDQIAQGEIVASGPAVVGGRAALGVPATCNRDGTLALI